LGNRKSFQAAASSQNETNVYDFVVFFKRKIEFIPSSEMEVSEMRAFWVSESDKATVNKTQFIIYNVLVRVLFSISSFWAMSKYFSGNCSPLEQEAQLPQRNSASAVHVYLGWLTDVQCTEHRRIAEVVIFLIFKRSDSRTAGRKRISSSNSHSGSFKFKSHSFCKHLSVDKG